MPPPLLIDGHVHLHPGVALPAALAAARAHFARAAAALQLPHDAPAALLLTEMAGVRRFDDVARLPGATFGADGASVLLAQDGAAPLLVVAGRQIVTAEGLEVLALATDRTFADGRPIGSTIEEALAAGAAVVLPFGVGKWTGRRGRIVTDLLAARPHQFLLGDNGNRAPLGAEPPQFRDARARGVWVLPGSDPLPLPRQEQRLGTFGFVVNHWHPTPRPAERLAQVLANLDAQPRTFGGRGGLGAFLRNQLAMQVRKRLRRATI